MEASKDTVWDILRGDYRMLILQHPKNAAKRAYFTGRLLKQCENDGAKFHSLFDFYVSYLMTNCSDVTVVRTVATWLSKCGVSPNPKYLGSYDDFHRQYGKKILRKDTGLKQKYIPYKERI